jgi:membrane protein required for colicin V production
VRNAKSRVVLENTGEWLQALLPQDMDNYLSNLLKRRPRGEEQEPPDAPPPDRRSDRGAPATTATVRPEAGYPRSDRTDMQQLIDATRR